MAAAETERNPHAQARFGPPAETCGAFLAAAFAFAVSLAQRGVSTRVRDVRRRVTRVTATIERRSGAAEAVTPAGLIRADESALAVATVARAAAPVTMRLT